MNTLKKNVVLYKELSAPLMQRLEDQVNVTLIKRLDAQGLEQLRAALPQAQGLLGASLKLDAQLLEPAALRQTLATYDRILRF